MTFRARAAPSSPKKRSYTKEVGASNRVGSMWMEGGKRATRSPGRIMNEVTVEVTDTSGETEVSSKQLAVDYSQPINRWDIPVSLSVG